MKKTTLIALFAVFILLSGCVGEGNIISSNSFNHDDKDEVIDRHGQVENRERLNNFIEKVQSNSKDKIRLTRYTIEGDPIYHDLDFDGTKLTLTLDTTEDEYGSGNVTTYECQRISKTELDTETKYELLGCTNGQSGELLTIPHNAEAQDLFEFELKYGKNEIDTKEMVMTKNLKNGEIKTISDFQLSTEQLNRIYKEMVYASFLQPKSLSSPCKGNSSERYELNVWINSGTRNFNWASCDQSSDGIEMTKLAQNIIKIVEESL